MRTQYLVSTVLVMMASITLNAYCAPGESIVLDPNTGDYLITYYGTGAPEDGENEILRKETFIPATKIDPTVKTMVKLKEQDTIIYTYRVTNSSKSKQSLIAMRFDPITTIAGTAGITALTTPNGWGGRNFESQTGKLRISWVYEKIDNLSAGLALGGTQGGFGFSSKDIPGIGIAQLSGNSPIRGFVDEGPDGEIADQLEKLTQNDFVPRNAAIPTIAVPDPFDASVTLERIQSHMHTWIDMQLLDATFSAQLDRYFQSAINAYRLNQPRVGKKQIQTMRELIKKEQHEADREDDNDDLGEKSDDNDKNKRVLIDKLAARILDFDLKYILKRLGED